MLADARLKAALLAGCALLVLAPAAQAQTSVRRPVAVAAGDLGQALTAIARRFDREVVVAADLVRGRRAPAVSGSLSLEEALDAALKDSGLGWRRTPTGAIVVERSGATEQVAVETDEVIVTAQRRDERGQDVPVAVSAYGRGAIDRLRLESLRDVSRTTPGLLVSAFGYNSPTIAIRGANNTFTQIGANKPVQVVIDDVFVTRNSAASFELYGLDSIQVLKGPQGTLFGRNVTGGAILIDTGRPAFGETAAHARATLGDYDARAFNALADLALGENAALRVAGTVRERDGFGVDRLTGRDLDGQDSKNARLQLRGRTAGGTEAILGLDYADDRNQGRTLSLVDGINGDDRNRRTAEGGLNQDFARIQWGASLRLFAEVGGGRLTSITAYRKSQSGDDYSAVGGNFTLLSGTQNQRFVQDRDDVGAFSQEVRWASPRYARGSYLVGAYYLDEDATRALRNLDFRASTGATALDQLNQQAVKTRSVAAFADGTVNLTDRLSATLGVRYTADRKRASLTRTDAIAASGSFATGELEKNWSQFTPRGVLIFKPTDDVLTYLSWTKGYTAGGYNTEAPSLVAAKTPFAPETLTSKELGVKSDWLGGRLRVNVALFEMKYDDKQELFVNGLTRVLNIVNAAKATMQGYEIETRAVPTDWLTLEATYGRLDAKYDDFVIPGATPTINTGKRLGSSPKEKTSLVVDLHRPIGAWGRAFAVASYSRTSDYNTGGNADPRLQIPAYDLINLSAGVEPAGGKWRLTAFVRNVEDTDYVLTYSTQVVRSEYLGEPRTWGVSLDWRF